MLDTGPARLLKSPIGQAKAAREPYDPSQVELIEKLLLYKKLSFYK